MNQNNVQLTDDELSVIMSSLWLTINSIQRQIDVNGDGSLDVLTMEVFNEATQLHNRIEKEFY